MSKQSILIEFSYHNDSIWLNLDDWPSALELISAAPLTQPLSARSSVLVYCYQWLARHLTPINLVAAHDNVQIHDCQASNWLNYQLSPLVVLKLGFSNPQLANQLQYKLNCGNYLQLEKVTPTPYHGRLQLDDLTIDWQLLARVYHSDGTSPWSRIDFSYQEEITSAYLNHTLCDLVNSLVSQLNQYLAHHKLATITIINIIPSCKQVAGDYWPLALNYNSQPLLLLLTANSWLATLIKNSLVAKNSETPLANLVLPFPLIHGRCRLSANEAANLSPGDVILFDQAFAPDSCAINLQRIDLIFNQDSTQQLSFQHWQSQNAH